MLSEEGRGREVPGVQEREGTARDWPPTARGVTSPCVSPDPPVSPSPCTPPAVSSAALSHGTPTHPMRPSAGAEVSVTPCPVEYLCVSRFVEISHPLGPPSCPCGPVS